MSGSNALAAAKRRRVDALSKPATPVARPNNSQQRPKATTSAPLPSARVQTPYPQPQPQPQQYSQQQQQQRGNVVIQRNQQPPPPPQNSRAMPPPPPVQSASFATLDDEPSHNIFVIPQPPEGVKINPLQLLTVHHAHINRIATHIPPALETLGQNFNMMSANCDNLNDRLEALEKNAGISTGGSSVASGPDPETLKKVELLSTAIATLSKTVEDLKSGLSRLQTFTNNKDGEYTRFKSDILSKHSALSSELDDLRSPIVELQGAVAELKSSLIVDDEEQDDEGVQEVEGVEVEDDGDDHANDDTEVEGETVENNYGQVEAEEEAS